ncbi:MAG: hypothetical protein MHM6MM_000081 [Cercozoa sp. M6MM]
MVKTADDAVRRVQKMRDAVADNVPAAQMRKLIKKATSGAQHVDDWFDKIKDAKKQWNRELSEAATRASETLKFELEATKAAAQLSSVDLWKHTVSGVCAVPVLKTGALPPDDLEARRAFLQQKNSIESESIRFFDDCTDIETSTATGTDTAIAIEHVRGRSLQQLLCYTKPFVSNQDLEKAVKATTTLMTPLCELVARLNANKLLHNDIAPGNVMFSSKDDSVCDCIERCRSLNELFDLCCESEPGVVFATLIDYGEASLSGRSRMHPQGCEAAQQLATNAENARAFMHKIRKVRLELDTGKEEKLLSLLKDLRRPASSHSQLPCFTPGYSAPESATLGMRSAFSLGAVLRSMVFGVKGNHCGGFVELLDDDKQLEELRRCEDVQVPLWARLLLTDTGVSVKKKWSWRYTISHASLSKAEKLAPELIHALDGLLDPRPLCRRTVQEMLTFISLCRDAYVAETTENEAPADTSGCAPLDLTDARVAIHVVHARQRSAAQQ